MIPPYNKSPNNLYTLRCYAGHDGWFDVKTNLSEADAVAEWNKETNNGTQHASYGHGDYFAIFPAGTRMVFRTEDSNLMIEE